MDAGIYHGARLGGLAPGLAATVARRAVPPIFLAVALASDVSEEREACRRGDLTPAEAVARVSVKTALNIAPIVEASLGPVAIAGAYLVGFVFRSFMR